MERNATVQYHPPIPCLSAFEFNFFDILIILFAPVLVFTGGKIPLVAAQWEYGQNSLTEFMDD
jgi:hypothetical protein